MRNQNFMKSLYYLSLFVHKMYKQSFEVFVLRDYIEERAISVAQYIVGYGATVRHCAERLVYINAGLAEEVRKVLDVNKAERHIRGGMATKEKYLHMQ